MNFKTFSPGNTPGLRENMFTSLAEDETGGNVGGTRDGLLRYQNGTFEQLDTSHGLPHARVDGLCRRRKGGVWAATDQGIAHVSGRKATVVVAMPTFAPFLRTARNGFGFQGVSASTYGTARREERTRTQARARSRGPCQCVL